MTFKNEKGTAGQRAGQCCSRLGAQREVGKLSVFQSEMIGCSDGQALKDEAQAGLRTSGFLVRAITGFLVVPCTETGSG